MTDITCRMIVQKGNEFYVGDKIYEFGEKRIPVFSQYVFQAKHFRNDKQAHEKAKAVGGRVRMFDKLNGELI